MEPVEPGTTEGRGVFWGWRGRGENPKNGAITTTTTKNKRRTKRGKKEKKGAHFQGLEEFLLARYVGG